MGISRRLERFNPAFTWNMGYFEAHVIVHIDGKKRALTRINSESAFHSVASRGHVE